MKAVRRGQPKARPQGATARESAPERWPIVSVVGAMLVVAVIAFLELRTFAGRHDGSSDAPEMTAAEAPRASVPASPLLPPAPAQPEAAAGGATAPIAARSSADAGTASEAPAQAAPPRLPSRKRAPPQEALKAPPAAVPPATITEPPPQVAAAPVRRVEAPGNDPLQNFNSALSRCAREDMVARLGCEQRARVQYCGDFWGQIPQCAIGRATDHGQ